MTKVYVIMQQIEDCSPTIEGLFSSADKRKNYYDKVKALSENLPFQVEYYFSEHMMDKPFFYTENKIG